MKSRRDFLRLTGSIAVGLGILLVSDGVVGARFLKIGAESLAAPFVAPNGAANSAASIITVKVCYTMMAQYIDVDEEDFVLQSPATVQTLIDTCILRHPSVAQMSGTMFILLDGAPSEPSAILRDGDSVQFIPLIAGG